MRIRNCCWKHGEVESFSSGRKNGSGFDVRCIRGSCGTSATDVGKHGRQKELYACDSPTREIYAPG